MSSINASGGNNAAMETRVTLSGNAPTAKDTSRAPGEIDATGQHTDYWVLSEDERGRGFVRPVRTSYTHDKCGGLTRMNAAIAETYARDPEFYGATFCSTCGAHFPVGADGEFTWKDGSKVGT